MASDDNVAVAWTGHLPGGADDQGLSLYLVTGGKIVSVRHASTGAPPG